MGYGDDFLSEMREKEFPHMKGEIYLDHAGATMYSKKQIQNHSEMLQQTMLANPHSLSTTSSQRTNEEISIVRHEIARHFNTTLEHYDVVFTSGATAGLKLIGETFPFTKESNFVYSMDSHNSVVGIRSFAQSKQADVYALPVDVLDTIAPSSCAITSPEQETYHLFAYPGECNFSGQKHSLTIVNSVQNNSLHGVDLGPFRICGDSNSPNGKWFVLLDAAKLAATNPIDLSKHQPDFMVCSFYKLFGYPTGLGALLIKRSSAKYLRKKYHGGGTLSASLSSMDFSRPRPEIYRQFEDGTISYLSILACKSGLDILHRLSMKEIQCHVNQLTRYAFQKLTNLRHVNGYPVCEIYGKHHAQEDSGSIVACNFLRSDGEYVGYTEFSNLAGLHNIHIRTGCFCNPGACQYFLKLSSNDLLNHVDQGSYLHNLSKVNPFHLGHVCGDAMDIIDGKPTGAIRLSFGYMTSKEDIDQFLHFVETYFVSRQTQVQNSRLIPSDSSIRLCRITIFPIKSCSGMDVERWKVGPRGLLFDREWALMDPCTEKVFRQKDLPQLTQIHPTIDLVAQMLHVTTTSLNLKQLSIPLSYLPRNSKTMQVCNDTCEGSKYDDFVNEWFTQAIGRPCSLVRVIPGKSRPTKQSYKNAIGFANEAQYLLLSRGSVMNMNSKLNENVSEDVFRANLIVDGCNPHEEDTWKEITMGNLKFTSLGPCSRCSMININQTTGEFQPAPLKTLASYRRQRAKIFFGQFLALVSYEEDGSICIGDAVYSVKGI